MMTEIEKIKKIMVATDGSEPSIRAIRHAIEMAREKDAEVLALSVNTTLVDVGARGYDVLAQLGSDKHVVDESVDVHGILTEYYDRIGKPESLLMAEAGLEIARTLGEDQGVRVTTLMEHGRASETILKVAEREKVNLIILGTTGLTGLSRILIGSTADKVTRLSKCPVMVIH
ncbi:MAG: universal stress protein [Actinobacteria bacterium]|nr:universal stress protein [Actinomycetota bacterium]MCL5887677.1 universal stress protein [Actinomycetota bacterium]